MTPGSPGSIAIALVTFGVAFSFVLLVLPAAVERTLRRRARRRRECRSERPLEALERTTRAAALAQELAARGRWSEARDVLSRKD